MFLSILVFVWHESISFILNSVSPKCMYYLTIKCGSNTYKMCAVSESDPLKSQSFSPNSQLCNLGHLISVSEPQFPSVSETVMI